MKPWEKTGVKLPRSGFVHVNNQTIYEAIVKMLKAESNPIVTVILPTFNRENLLNRSMQSVLNQTFEDFELIVVDDGSTDNTEKVVRGFNDERVRYIRHHENSGTSATPRNIGIKAAKGKYIALLDSDDEWLPEKLEKQINKFKSVSSDTGLVYHGYFCVYGDDGGQTPEIVEVDPKEKGDVFELAVEKLSMGDTTPLVKKECYEKVGGYKTEFLSCQSWDLWIRVSRHYKFDYVPDILYKYYIHGKQNVVNLERRIQGLDRITRKYQQYLSKPVLFHRIKRLGNLCCCQGDFKRAGSYFREARIINPSDIYSYIRLFLCKFAPKLFQSLLKRRYTKIANREHNGIILW